MMIQKVSRRSNRLPRAQVVRELSRLTTDAVCTLYRRG